MTYRMVWVDETGNEDRTLAESDSLRETTEQLINVPDLNELLETGAVAVWDTKSWNRVCEYNADLRQWLDDYHAPIDLDQ